MFPEESRGWPAGREAVTDPRIADTDRDRVVAVLRLHCTEGRITLDEFSDRVGDVYNARTQSELDAVVADLPVPWSAEAPPEPVREAKAPRRPVQWLVAVFSNSSRRGMSMPSRILAIWSRTRASTSSFTPVSAPMAPLAILVRSSMKGLRVCMTVTPDAASMGGW